MTTVSITHGNLTLEVEGDYVSEADTDPRDGADFIIEKIRVGVDTQDAYHLFDSKQRAEIESKAVRAVEAQMREARFELAF